MKFVNLLLLSIHMYTKMQHHILVCVWFIISFQVFKSYWDNQFFCLNDVLKNYLKKML